MLGHYRCAYCLTSETNSGIPLTIDHILPVSAGGESGLENLCLACRPCNEFKASLTQAQDPLTGDIVALFNPRLQRWDEHFVGALTELVSRAEQQADVLR